MLVSAAGAQANKPPAPPDPQSQTRVSNAAPAKTAKKHHFTIGIASWYGKLFQGRKTATGETYNMYEFTAASKTLPLGSYAKVTNLKNKRWVLVRVNDRGPMVAGRIIDLSYRAASVLNLTERGIQKVRVEVVPSNEPGETVAMLNRNDALD